MQSMALTPKAPKLVEFRPELANLITRSTVVQTLQLYTEPENEDLVIEMLPQAVAELEAAKISSVEVWNHKQGEFAQLPVKALNVLR